MESYIFWTFTLGVLAVLCAGEAVFVRAYLTGTPPSALLFQKASAAWKSSITLASIAGASSFSSGGTTSSICS